MTAIRGAAAAVTGAASGIGRALAHELAARGCDLALADRDEAGLQAVAAEIAKHIPRKITCTGSMSASPAQIAAFAQAAIAAHPALNILINNAGVALLGQFTEIDQAQMEWLFNINFWGVVHCTPRLPAAFVPTARSPHRQPVLDLRHHRAARADRPMRRRNSRCAAFPKACAMSWRWRIARSNFRWCIPAASPPTSRATPEPASASPTMPGVRKPSSCSTSWRRPRRKRPRCASSRASRRTQPRILIGKDARFMDLLQRFRPGTYWCGAGAAHGEDGGAEVGDRYSRSSSPAQ